MRLKIFQCLLIVIGVLAVSRCSSSPSVSSQTSPEKTSLANQNNNTVTYKATIIPSNPTDEGTIDGRLKELTIKKLTLEEVLKQPAPDVWFVFSCDTQTSQTNKDCVDGKLKRNPSPELQNLVNIQWQEVLEYNYKVLSEKRKNAQDESNFLSEHLNKSSGFEKQVEALTIEAPLGQRRISMSEAGDLVSFLNSSASDTIKIIKEKQ